MAKQTEQKESGKSGMLQARCVVCRETRNVDQGLFWGEYSRFICLTHTASLHRDGCNQRHSTRYYGDMRFCAAVS